jgi:hypothetical protein
VVATDATTGAVLTANPTLSAGQSVDLVLHGFTPGEGVGVTLHSTPQTLLPATASSTGVITYAFTVPTGLPAGAHSVVFAGATSGTNAAWSFSIVAPNVEGTTTSSTPSASLPFTGANASRQLLVAVAAVWSGLILLVWARPRRPIFEVGGRHRATLAVRGRHRQTTHRRS